MLETETFGFNAQLCKFSVYQFFSKLSLHFVLLFLESEVLILTFQVQYLSTDGKR